MTTLTYEKASVLARVEGMPVDELHGVGGVVHPFWFRFKTGCDAKVIKCQSYRLTPGADLTPNQAAICLAMGVGILGHTGTMGVECTELSHMLFCTPEGYRVPPAQEDSE